MDIRVMRRINEAVSVEMGIWLDGQFMDTHDSRSYLKNLGFNSREAALYTRAITQVEYDKEG